MAVIRTGSIFKTLRFGNVDSGDFGIYITGSAVYNAPERAVERVSVPGRNGALILDQGHFENVPVTYPAGTFATSPGEFTENIGAFRNAVLSQLGYQRLEDDYNPDEYRMANASAGFDVESAPGGVAGEFELVFDCKPQRFLTSGESDTTIASSGDTITNPTLFKSEPLVVLDGYGKVAFNGHEMEVFNVPIGAVNISGSVSESAQIYASEVPSWTYAYNLASFENGDLITVSGLSFVEGVAAIQPNVFGIAGSGVPGVTAQKETSSANYFGRKWLFPALAFTVGTDQTYTHVVPTKVQVTSIDGQTGLLEDVTLTMTIAHNASAGTITFSLQSSLDVAVWNAENPNYPISRQETKVAFESIAGMSSASSISDPVYIDTEIGEAYIIQGGEPVSVNNSVSIGAELPRLAPGANTVTFDNTFDSVKIRPRWWRL